MASPRSNIASNNADFSLPEVAEHGYDGKETVTSHGIEVAGADAKELQNRVAGANDKELQNRATEDADGPEAVGVNSANELELNGAGGGYDASQKRSRKRRLYVLIALAAIVVLAIALGVGLGVGLNKARKRSDSSSASPASAEGPGSVGDQYLSKRGAFNGTGIAWTGVYGSINMTSQQSRDDDSYRGNDKFLFFQHHTGTIRWIYQAGPDDWRGGSVHEIVATDAKNGTPIAARTPAGPAGFEHDVYYVDKDNYLRQRTADRKTYTWTDGPLNDLNIKVIDADRIGLRACLYLGPIPDVPLEQTQGHGTRLFVATVGFEQQWSEVNGHASPACYGWHKGQTFYAWFVNSQNTIEMWWRDTANATSTATHPINQWTQSSLTYPAVNPFFGLDFQFLLYGELATGGMQGWNMTINAEASSMDTTALATVDGPPPTSNSRFAVSSFTQFGGRPKEAFYLFYQTQGDDITMSTGDPVTGEWNSTKIRIPDD